MTAGGGGRRSLPRSSVALPLSSPLGPALLVLAAAGLPFLGTLGYEFVWDDTLLIEQSHRLRQWRSLPALLASQLWAEAQEVSYYYRPLVVLSFFADMQLWGQNPLGFHLSNVVLHAATSLGVFALGRRLAGRDLAAALAGVLFALHPIHTESVAFISGRSDVLSTLFVVLSVAAYVRWRAGGGRLVLAGSLAAYALALAAKEVAVVLPALLVVCDRAWRDDVSRAGRTSARALLRSAPWRYLPWLGVLGVYLVVRAAVLGRLLDAGGNAWVSLPIRALTALDAAAWYLRVALVPYPPHPYPVAAIVPWPAPPSAWAGILLLGLGLAATIAVARAQRVMGLGALWFWVGLLPGVAVILMPTATSVIGERFLYLPSVGLCLLAGLLLERVLGGPSRHRRAAAVGVAGLVLASLLLTLWRNEDWRDNYRLYSRMVETSPRADLPRVNLAFTQLPLGEIPAARLNLAEATRLAPRNGRAWAGLALTEALMGAHEASRDHGQHARALAPTSAAVLATVGAADLVRGEPDAAAARLTESLRLNPHQVHATLNLAVALSRAGRQVEAEAALDRGRQLADLTSPGLPLVHTMAAEVLGRRDPTLAIAVWQDRVARLRAAGVLSSAQQVELAHAEQQIARLTSAGPPGAPR